MGRPTRYTHENDDTIERKYVAGASLSALSREYGIPVMTIKRRLQKRGVEIRNLTTAMKVMKDNRKGRATATNDRSGQNISFGVQFDDSGQGNSTNSNDEWIS